MANTPLEDIFLDTKDPVYAEYLIKTGKVNINCQCAKTGGTKLHMATFYRLEEMVEMLVKNGIDQFIKNNEGEVAANTTSTYNIYNLLKDSFNEGKVTVLDKIIKYKQYDAAKFVISCVGAKVSIEHFMKIENVDFARWLIESGHININCQDKNNRTRLHKAVEGLEDTMVEMLVEKGIDQKIKDNEGNVAVNCNSFQAIWNILKDNINEPNNKGETVLYRIVSYTPFYTDNIKFLISIGAKYNIVNKEGKTAYELCNDKGIFPRTLDTIIIDAKDLSIDDKKKLIKSMVETMF